jgi:hypothetical protein
MTRPETLASSISVHYEAAKEFNDETFISHLAINITLASFAIGQSPTAQQPANTTSEQEVRQMIEKYRTAILQRDIATLEKI